MILPFPPFMFIGSSSGYLPPKKEIKMLKKQLKKLRAEPNGFRRGLDIACATERISELEYREQKLKKNRV